MIQAIFITLALMPCILLLVCVFIFYRDAYKEKSRKTRLNNIHVMKNYSASDTGNLGFAEKLMGKAKQNTLDKQRKRTYTEHIRTPAV